MDSLNEIIKVNDGFKRAVNLYLNLNKTDKILSYIPTKSSVNILNQYMESVLKNKEQASVLIGPYGKGKSHLLLVLLAVLSLERTDENNKTIKKVIEAVKNVDVVVANQMENIWNEKKRFLPIIISSSYSDLNQAFLLALNDVLKREGLTDLVPDTYYSAAVESVENWKNNYAETFNKFVEIIKEKNISYTEIIADLNGYDKNALDVFCSIYPKLTSGSKFNPMINTDILPLYKSINEKLCANYQYRGIYIVFDEFSKFIESRDKKSVGNEMKLLQDICELAGESSKNAQLFITLVTHKSIKEYANYLGQNIINSFLGIEGRIVERYFTTSSKNNYELIQNAIIKKDNKFAEYPELSGYFTEENAKKYYDIPVFRTMFEYKDFKKIIWKGCFPLNPLSAYVLLNISEKVAQNERTLFTFISKDETNSMARYVRKHNISISNSWTVNADVVYDYFKNEFQKDISNTFVHDEWLKSDYAISKTDDENEKKILKCLALINIINKPDELSARALFLYLASQIDETENILDELVKKDLIYQKGSTNCYSFKTRVGADLKHEIKKRRSVKGEKYNISSVFENTSGMNFEIPKQYNQDFYMTRYFRYEFIDYETFMSIDKSDSFFDENKFCDGKILLIICAGDEKPNKQKIIEKLNLYKDQRIIVIKPGIVYTSINLIQDYEILKELTKDKNFIENNQVLIKEIDIFEEEISNEINDYIEKAYSLKNEAEAYYFNGDKAVAYLHSDINRLVSEICRKYFNKTPVINNELINKNQITSSPIKKARKAIIDYILSGKNNETFYKGTNPEATIYRTTFIRTNILDKNPDTGMKSILKEFLDFMKECSVKCESLDIIIKKLISSPYGMRKGVIPLYLAYVLGSKIDDIVVYFGTKEVLLTSDIVINMVKKPEDYKLLVASESIEREQYIEGLLKTFNVEDSYNLSSSRLNNIILSMQRWFRALPQFTRNFKKKCSLFSNENLFNVMLMLKPLLQKADANPYEILFVKLPEACSDDRNLDDTLKIIQEFKKMLESHMNYVIKQTIKETILIFDKKGKQDLYHTLKEWYEKQSNMSKEGLYDNKITGLMNFIQELDTYDDISIVEKVVKIISNVYIENWNDNSLEEYKKELIKVKEEIEKISDVKENMKNKKILSFIDSNGNKIERYYESVSENTGSIMRNIFEDTLDDFTDLSVNEKVAILLEMIEKILK
ncbi:hypothetical protein CLRAG_09780 [Clostridium ragsdalei P11]|uniref:Uncharacterized protein n=1 Tax=Clostridium ragsdalei P11 TaxID=1353534 RepID=A0A1A6AYN1_9CLOT|nr:hypothetical protein [Clostridium ragsdalei]OBR95140.1 hypothetical protein CLRAG_09780 [Clostridium ragsdalei P11]